MASDTVDECTGCMFYKYIYSHISRHIMLPFFVHFSQMMTMESVGFESMHGYDEVCRVSYYAVISIV
jgi:hypothetical protein